MASNANYAATVAVATATYPATAQYIPNIAGVVLIEHPGTVSNLITFSFDGTNDAGFVLPGTFKRTDSEYGPVFLKGAAATSTTVYISTERG